MQPANQRNLEGFNPIVPFCPEKPLMRMVVSDHAEVGVQVADQRVMMIWNISNPAHHLYFQSGPKPPFKDTHLFVAKPAEDPEGFLETKIQWQIDSIARDFADSRVKVQVIVEGYKAFYDQLASAIHKKGRSRFEIISRLDSEPEFKATSNVSALLVNTAYYNVLYKGVMREDYVEAANGLKKDLTVPFACLEDTITKKTMVVAAVHIPGADNHNPETGLSKLDHIMKCIRREQSDVIAAGDFNTPPMTSRAALPEAEIFIPPYFTHVNPRSEAVIYDQVAVLRGSDPMKYEMLTNAAVSGFSKALIASIDSNLVSQP